MKDKACVIITLEQLAQIATRIDAEDRGTTLEGMRVECAGYRDGVGLAVYLTKERSDAPGA